MVRLSYKRYWELHFPTDDQAHQRDFKQALEEYRNLLVDATQIRLRADVPVGAYLSGGLDSSTTSAIIRNFTNSHLDTFSITFENPEFDEGDFQMRMAKFLGTDHHIVHATHADIGRAFPDVIWHCETPITRTAPVPMYLLSKLVRDNHYKVVMTGEGADEFLAGYDIFKEAKIRRFWARQPDSKIRPLLLNRLYPEIPSLSSGNSYLASFYGIGLQNTEFAGLFTYSPLAYDSQIEAVFLRPASPVCWHIGWYRGCSGLSTRFSFLGPFAPVSIPGNLHFLIPIPALLSRGSGCYGSFC